MEFCLRHFNVGIWSSMPTASLVKTMTLLLNKDHRISLKFFFGKEKLQLIGRDMNKNDLYSKLIKDVFLRMPHRIRENVTLFDSTSMSTLCNPFFSSLYAPTYLGNEDDSFLKEKLIPFLLDFL